MTETFAELPRLGIGKVLDELLPEFPDLTITKIRYLESQGLIEPERTPSGYRKFTYGDVERLRFVLRKQRDDFWPLSHIRQVLDDMDQGVVPPTELGETVAVPHLKLAEDGLPSAETFSGRRSQVRLSREELLASARISEEMLDAAEQFGLVRRANRAYYDGHALQVASLVAEFTALGVEPRHLRIFRQAVDREIGLFDQVVEPRRRSEDPQQAAQAVAELAALAVRLHTVMLQDGLG